jgi:EmrB/QacA subfamily drug resistance transporter
VRSPSDPRARRWWVLATMTGSLSMITLNQTVIAVALPTLRADLDASRTSLQWMVAAYVLGLGAFVAVGGRLADRFGQRRMFAGGVTMFALASVLGAFAWDDSIVVAARAMQGIGAGLMQPASTSTVIDTFEEGERGRAMALFIGVSSAFTAIGPLLGGFFVELVSWRSVFVLNLPIAVAALVLVAIVRPPNNPRPDRAIDLPGAVLITLGLSGIVLGLQQGQDWGWASVTTIATVVGGLALLVLLGRVERRSPAPLLDLGLLRDRHTWVGALVTFGVRFALLGVTVFTTLFIQDTLGFSPLTAGVAILPVVLALLVATQVSGRLYDRRGAWFSLVPGTALIAVGLAVTAPALSAESYPLLLPGLLVVGIGMGLCSSATTVALAHVPQDRRGQGSGMVQTLRQLGGSIGVAAIGGLDAAFGLQSAYLLSAGAMAVVCVATALGLPRDGARPVRAPGAQHDVG